MLRVVMGVGRFVIRRGEISEGDRRKRNESME